MAEELTITAGASPRPARLSNRDREEMVSTGEFLDPSHLYSVIVDGGVVKGTSENTFFAEAESETSARQATGMNVRFETQPPKLVQLAATSREHYAMLKKYDGFVVAHNDESFVARLYENASDYPVMEAEFAIEEISEADRRLLVEGARLVWTISYRHEGTTRSRDSSIYLRRAEWTAQDFATAAERTSSFIDGINWDESSASGE